MQEGSYNMQQYEMFTPLPTKLLRFDSGIELTVGEHIALGKQILVVLEYIADNNWHTVSEISENTGIQANSVDAQLRNLRKDKHGGFDVEYQRISRVAHYRLNEKETT
jgi:DNA-binding CsgD family transcriptional regulator